MPDDSHESAVLNPANTWLVLLSLFQLGSISTFGRLLQPNNIIINIIDPLFLVDQFHSIRNSQIERCSFRT